MGSTVREILWGERPSSRAQGDTAEPGSAGEKDNGRATTAEPPGAPGQPAGPYRDSYRNIVIGPALVPLLPGNRKASAGLVPAFRSWASRGSEVPDLGYPTTPPHA